MACLYYYIDIISSVALFTTHNEFVHIKLLCKKISVQKKNKQQAKSKKKYMNEHTTAATVATTMTKNRKRKMERIKPNPFQLFSTITYQTHIHKYTHTNSSKHMHIYTDTHIYKIYEIFVLFYFIFLFLGMEHLFACVRTILSPKSIVVLVLKAFLFQ